MIKTTRGLALVVVIGAWLAGILLESWVSLPAFALLAGASAALLCLIPLWRDSQARLIMFIILWLLLGAWRFAIASPTGDAHAISAFIGTGQVEVRGTVADEPKLSGRSRLVQIDVSGICKNGGKDWQDAHGQLEAETLGGEIEDPYGPNYGDNVELRGKVQAPIPHSSPGIFASMAFPRISVNSSGGNPIIATLYHFRTTLATLISQSLPQSESALLIAILLSLRTPALKPLIPFFNETGTAHLIAPSGFKVTILAGLVAASTRWLYEKPGTEKILPAQKRGNLRHWIATVLTISSIAAYTMLNGAGPAALRAGIMGLLLVLAPRLGRTYNIYTALALAALLMSLFNPFIVWDAGFQLSFLGTLGIVLFTPLFQRLLQPIEPLPSVHFITEIIAVTLAAQIATLPIFALDFKEISFIAPIANTLTVPLLGIVIFIGMLMCGAGMLFVPLATYGSWVAWPMLWYMSHIVIWCAQIPDAFIQVNNVCSGLAWFYFTLLSFLGSVVLYKWPAKNPAHRGLAPVLHIWSRRPWRMSVVCRILSWPLIEDNATEKRQESK